MITDLRGLDDHPQHHLMVSRIICRMVRKNIALLAVTDDQEFILLFIATPSSKDIMETDVILRGVSSDPKVEINKDLPEGQAGNKADEVTAIRGELSRLKE